MKTSKLLATHHAIIQQARLANCAQAYITLRRFAERVRRARLSGSVNLRQPKATEGRFWASLTALEGNQSVLDEHFSDEEIMEFADAVAFARDNSELDSTFRLEAMRVEFVTPLETTLKQSSVVLDLEDANLKDGSEGFPHPHSSGTHHGATPDLP